MTSNYGAHRRSQIGDFLDSDHHDPDRQLGDNPNTWAILAAASTMLQSWFASPPTFHSYQPTLQQAEPTTVLGILRRPPVLSTLQPKRPKMTTLLHSALTRIVLILASVQIIINRQTILNFRRVFISFIICRLLCKGCKRLKPLTQATLEIKLDRIINEDSQLDKHVADFSGHGDLSPDPAAKRQSSEVDDDASDGGDDELRH
jgi:hypothetical protein